MTELRGHNFSISLDGDGAGRDQSVDNQLGPERRRAGRTCAWAAVSPRCRSTCGRGWPTKLHVVIAPVLLGGGERLFDGLGDALDGWGAWRSGRRQPPPT
jgi:hypothetical protein